MEPERIRHEWPDGSPRLEAWQRNGHYVGEYRTYSKRGTLEQHVCYDDDGLPHGEAVVFNAELQRLQELSFDRGMVEVPASRLEALGKRLADPAVYAPDVLGPVAPQAHHKQLLWGLWRRGHLALGGLPGRWRDLADDVRGVGADDVLALLRESVDAPQDMLRLQVRVLPYWTFDMDRLVMQVAARDVAPFLAALPDLPMPLRDGVRTALRRLGVPAETTGPFEGDLAVELARQQVEGLFQASVLRQGKVVTVELRNPGPTEHWDPFVASLVDPADVRRHLVDAVVVAQRSELSIDHVDEAWRHAEGTAEVVAFCRKLGPPYGDPLGHVHRVLSTREDGPDALLELADAFGQANMEAWQQGALLYALARGADPSVASRLTFTAWREPGAPLEAVARVEERWFPILDTVPRDALQAALGKRLGSAYVVGGLAPFVARYGDRASWERLLELEAANNAASALRFRGALAEGFGRALGADDLGWLDARIRATEDLTLKTALVWAMLRALERCEGRARPAELKSYGLWKLKGKDRSDKEVVAEVAKLQKKLARWAGSKTPKAAPKKAPKAKKVDLRTLADALVKRFGTSVTLDVFQPSGRKPARRSTRRVGGLPIGVTETTWPTHEGQQMLHVITVHRDDAPNAFRLLRDEIVAAAVFADERTPRALEVLHLTAADLRSGEAEVDPLREQRATSYTMSTLEVPAQVFDPPGADEDLAQLRTLVLQLPGFGGGAPLWLRGETSGPAAFAELATFQLQVDERLVPNLSLAGGILYVMVDGARVEA